MRTWPQRLRKPSRIEIIPMIDVMMFLLVFFVLISINALPALGLRSKVAVIIAGDRRSQLQELVDVLDALQRGGVSAASITTKPR